MSDTALTSNATSASPLPAGSVDAQPKKILERNFSMDGSFAHTRSSLTLPVGWELSDALSPEFWMNVAHWFQPDPRTGEADRAGTIIEVRTEDHAFYAELYVRGVRGNVLDVAILTKPIFFGPQGATGTPEYEIRWNVGHRGFDIIRQSARVIVESGNKLPTKELALAWIEKTSGVKVAA